MEGESLLADTASSTSDFDQQHLEKTDTADSSNSNKIEIEKKSQDNTGDQEVGEKKDTPPKKAGIAHIKPEFILQDYKPKIQTEYLSEDSKRKIAAVNEENQTAEDADTSEPPNKKQKLKGRNKQRPRNERIEQKDKLCPSVKSGKTCNYGDSCKFNHDVNDFLEKKRPDIQEKCPVFARLGFCKFGVTCRFASSHLGDNHENLVNNDLYDTLKEKPLFLNTLSDDVRRKLWKRKYDFSKAMKSVNHVQKTFRNGNDKGATQVCDKQKEGSSAGTTHEKGDESKLVTEAATVNEDVSPTEPAPSKSLAEDVSVSDKVITTDNNDIEARLTPREVKKIDFHDKLYLAPLTTVGNLPFRRVCKDYGVDITCSEMALASQLLKAKASEWSLIKRHPCEDIFGVQVCGAYPDMMSKCAQVLTETSDIDFIDINCGCPIDLVFKKGSGSALMGKVTKLEQICRSMRGVMGETPLTVKLRTGVFDNKSTAHTIIPRLRDAGVSLVTIHGRSREQRYTKLADWDYIDHCASLGGSMPVFGNGDILSYEDANLQMARSGVSGVMIARGALIKPWIFTEIKEQRHWDISSSERFDILRSYTNYGLEHWGSDHQGVETTRRFLLEWISFLHRYIPVGVLEQVPQRINERPPYYIGRNDLETMMASANCADWIKISEMLLGPVPSSFQFLPKHKANAYQ